MMCVSRWAASRRLFRLTIPMARSGTLPPSRPPSVPFRTNFSKGCAGNLRPARSCITARVNGIPASRCRAGRSAATGARTVCPSGKTTRSSPKKRWTTGTPPGIPKSSSPPWLPGWASGPWFLRSQRLYLAPGDSPMGLRLPLDSLPWVKPSDYPYLNELDPTVERPPLPAPEEFRQRYLQTDSPARRKAALLRRRGQSEAEAKKAALREDPTRLPKSGESAAWIVRTALCVEPRAGKLHVFMPPVATLEDYLELVAAVEDTAAELQTPVAIEGYTPPHDLRLNVLKVTPDPGVIEVNLHPSQSWDELV